jgi:hypothetical protein
MPDEVRAVDALVALRDDRADAEEAAFPSRPVARAARSILVAGEDDERHAFRLVAHRGVEDGHPLSRGADGR